MSNLFRPRQSFLQNNAWQNQALNALHYSTSQQGSVVPLIYGTLRQTVNLIDLGNYRGPKGKKGKSGSLPLAGTSQTGKGGGSSKGKGGKKNADYTVNVDFGICQGPITFNSNNSVYSSSGVESFSATGLYFYNGSDDQALDSVLNTVNYSGTCHVVGKPIDLGQSPVLPNLAFEITGILAGVHTGTYSLDANPADVITDFLTDVRYGAGFPSSHLSQLAHDDSGTITNTYGDYCQAALLMVSVSLDGHQKAIEWLDGITKLTNSVLVWSGGLLKVVPYGDLNLSNNGATWSPNWTHQYELTDNHFLPWHPRDLGSGPTPGEDDPLILTRTNPADADDWVSIEYLDRLNFYNSTTITSFDQGAIDTYGLRIGDSLPGRAFANEQSAQISLQLTLQRRLYIRNTGIKFQLGWQFCLLEPMDLVGLTGRAGDSYLSQYTVRITSIEENDNGDLTLVCEDPQPGTSAPFSVPFIPAILQGDPAFAIAGGSWFQWNNSTYATTDPRYDSIYDWRATHPPDSPTGTFSVWIAVDPAHAPVGATRVRGFLQTDTGMMDSPFEHFEIALFLDTDNSVAVVMHDVRCFQTAANVIRTDDTWQHIMISWNLPSRVQIWVDGTERENTISTPSYPPTITYSTEGFIVVSAVQSGLHLFGSWFLGCMNDFWWDSQAYVNDPGKFRNVNGTPKDLGSRGDNPLGRPPDIFLHFPGARDDPKEWEPISPGSGYWGINRAGYRCDDPAYWVALNNPTHATSGPGAAAQLSCDPAHQNLSPDGDLPGVCAKPYLPYR